MSELDQMIDSLLPEYRGFALRGALNYFLAKATDEEVGNAIGAGVFSADSEGLKRQHAAETLRNKPKF